MMTAASRRAIFFWPGTGAQWQYGFVVTAQEVLVPRCLPGYRDSDDEEVVHEQHQKGASFSGVDRQKESPEKGGDSGHPKASLRYRSPLPAPAVSAARNHVNRTFYSVCGSKT
jgi:hypothetical protein